MIPKQSLQFEEAADIYSAIMNDLTHEDETGLELIRKVQTRAVRYAHIRATWDFKSREEKMDADPERTSAHDAFMVSLTILARYQKEAGESWLARLDQTDRKRMGDFACYVALFLSLYAR